MKVESARAIIGRNIYDALPIEGEYFATPLKQWLLERTRQERPRVWETSVAVYLVLAIYAEEDYAKKLKEMRTADDSEFLFSKVLCIDATVEDDATEASTTRLFDKEALYWGPDNKKPPPVAKIQSFEQIINKEYPAHVLFLGIKDEHLAQTVLGTIGRDKRHNRLRLVISTFELTYHKKHWREQTVNDGDLACEGCKPQFFCYTLVTYAGEEQVQSQQTTTWKRDPIVRLSPTLEHFCNLNMPFTLQDLLANEAFSKYDANANRHCLKNGYLKLFVRTAHAILSGIDLLKRKFHEKYGLCDAKECLEDMVLVYLGAGQPNPDPKRMHLQRVAELFQMRMILYDTNEMEFKTTDRMLKRDVEVRVKEPENTDWYGTIVQHDDNGKDGNYWIVPIGETDAKQMHITSLQLARVEYRKKMFTMAEANVLKIELEESCKFGILLSDIRSGISSAVEADELVQAELEENHRPEVKAALGRLSQRLKDTMGDMAERDNLVQFQWYQKLSGSASQKGCMLLYSAKYFNRHAVPTRPGVETPLPKIGTNLIETFIPSTETNWFFETETFKNEETSRNMKKKTQKKKSSEMQYVKKWKLCKHKLLGGKPVEKPANWIFEVNGVGFATSRGSNQPIGAYVVVDSRYYKPAKRESFTDDSTTVITQDYIFQLAPGGLEKEYTSTNLIPHDKDIKKVHMRQSRSDSTYFMQPEKYTRDDILQDEQSGVYYRRVTKIESEEFEFFNASQIDNAMYNLHAITDPNHTQENCIMIRAMLTLCKTHAPDISNELCEVANKEYTVAIHKYVDHSTQKKADKEVKQKRLKTLLTLIKLEVGLLTWNGVKGDELKAKVWAYFSEVWKGWQKAVYLTAPSTWDDYRPSIKYLPGLPDENLRSKPKEWYESCIYWYSMWLHLLPKTKDLATISQSALSGHLTSCWLFQEDAGKIMLDLGRRDLQSPGTWPISKPVLYVAIELGILPLVQFLLSGTNCMTLLRTPLRRKACTYNPLGYALYYNKTTEVTNTNFHKISMHILDRCVQHLHENVYDVRCVMAEENLMTKDESESVRYLAQDKPDVLEKIDFIETKIREIYAAMAQNAAESPPANESNQNAKD